MSGKNLISIVVPAYNEAGNVERAYRAIAAEVDALVGRYDFEIVFIDDHSSDRTAEILRILSRDDSRIRVYRFLRNYGVQRAVHTAFSVAKGDAAIMLDCDLQDPPSLIPQFLEQWEAGYRVVYGVRRTRKEGVLMNASRKLFYWLIDKLSFDELPRDAGDCRLIDRCVMEQLRRIRDPNIYVRGRIASMGFAHCGVPYDRDAREHGKSSFTLLSLMGVALDGITSHSVIPLRLATFLGLCLMLVAGFGIVFFVTARLAFGADWPAGFATLVVLLLFSTGLNGLFLGILGEYLARMYAQLKVSPEPLFESRTSGGEIEPCDTTLEEALPAPDATTEAVVRRFG